MDMKNENIEVTHCIVEHATPRTPIPLPYIPQINDPRRRCALVLGDCFTQGFLAALNLRDKVRCSVDDHFSADNKLLYYPLKNDRFKKSPLWHPEKWPKLYSFWLACGSPKGSDFYLMLPRANIDPTLHRGELSFDTAAIGYELRCYLWHYFRSVNAELFPLRMGDGQWHWIRVLHMLLSEFVLSVHTFNYDLIIETLLKDAFDARLDFLIEERDIPVDLLPLNTVCIFKMHGGIAYKKPSIDSAVKVGETCNPWLDDVSYRQNKVVGGRTIFDRSMEEFPPQPEIVPPGHAGEDKFHSDSSVVPLSKDRLAKSDVVIFCGLSAREPDTEEVADLVSVIKKDALLIHVGMPADQSGELLKLFRASGLSPVFVGAGSEDGIPSIVGGRVSLMNRWF